MSLYNMINGVNPATFIILPMLGEKHPDSYPRFRDCFITDDDKIAVYTRVGGNNRNSGYGEEELYKHPNFMSTEDDEYDNTYATYYFSVPTEWEADFNLIKSDEVTKVSNEYKDRLYKVYPKLIEQWDILFNKQ